VACGGEALGHAFDARDLREGTLAPARYLRCLGCGTLALDCPPETASLSASYEEGEVDPVGPPQLPPEPGAARRLLRALSDALALRPHSLPPGDGAGRTLLDVGCLGGDKLVEFARRGFQVSGVDLNRGAIARARLLLPEGRFHEGPLDSLPPGEGFDFIRCDNVLEHVPDPLALVQQARARLRPGGRFFLYVPSGEALSVRLLGGRSVNVWVPWHLHLFSRAGLQALLARAGFADVQVTPYTPLSWWELTARQLVSEAGAFRRAPGLPERAAALAARGLSPAFLLLGKTPLGEEWVVSAGDGPARR
jgi:SAM-dependent methyltransferase